MEIRLHSLDGLWFGKPEKSGGFRARAENRSEC